MLRTTTVLVLCVLLAFAFSTTALAADGFSVASPDTDDGLVDDVVVPTSVSGRTHDAGYTVQAPVVRTVGD